MSTATTSDAETRGELAGWRELHEQHGWPYLDEMPPPEDPLAHGYKFFLAGDAKGGGWSGAEYRTFPDGPLALLKFQRMKQPKQGWGGSAGEPSDSDDPDEAPTPAAVDGEEAPAGMRVSALALMARHPPAPDLDQLRENDVVEIRQVDRLSRTSDEEKRRWDYMRVRRCLDGQAELVPIRLRGSELSVPDSAAGGHRLQTVDKDHPLVVAADAIGDSESNLPFKFTRWWRDEPEVCLVRLKRSNARSRRVSPSGAVFDAIDAVVAEHGTFLLGPPVEIAPVVAETQPHEALLPDPPSHLVMAGGATAGEAVLPVDGAGESVVPVDGALMTMVLARLDQLERQLGERDARVRHLESQVASILSSSLTTAASPLASSSRGGGSAHREVDNSVVDSFVWPVPRT
jgi:hypothetical protein